MRKHLLLAWLGGLGAFGPGRAAPAPAVPPTVVYIVRHAEKNTATGLTDPPLTAVGAAHARQLRRVLGGLQPAALFTTDTRRTRATLAPLAQAVRRAPQLYDEAALPALAARISHDYQGDTVVIVSHCHSLMPLLKALGANVPAGTITVDKAELDYLYTVEMRQGQPSRVRVSHYGAK